MKEYEREVLSYSSSNINLIKRSIFDLSGVILVNFQGDIKTKNAYHHKMGTLCSILD